jgi:hypothetical protein
MRGEVPQGTTGIAGKQSEVRKEEQILLQGSQRKPICNILLLVSSLQNCDTSYFSCLSYPVCGALLWRPKQTTTGYRGNKRG